MPKPGPALVEFSWDYDSTEIRADAIVHAAGVTLALLGVVTFLVTGAGSGWRFAASAVYGASLILMMTISALYNLWPVCAVKWLLRRLDHATIYLLIAGTYTPLIAALSPGARPLGLAIGLWLAAGLGIALKLAFPGRYDRFAVLLCLALGWSGVLLLDEFVRALPPVTLVLIAVGGLFYSTGVVFHLWEGLRFQNAIWHGFVLVAAMCHFAAIATVQSLT